MGRYCIVPGCISNTKESYMKGESKKTMFSFPKEDTDLELLDEWKDKIPKDFNIYQINKKTVICEDHFEPKLLRNKINADGKEGSTHLKRLVQGAVPTIFSCATKTRKERTRSLPKKEKIIPRADYDEKCRFCLEIIELEKLEITDKIRRQFSILTQMDLRNSSVYSNFICKKCHHNLAFSVNYKAKLIEKQTRLYQKFQALEEKNNFKDEIYRIDIVENIKHEPEPDCLEVSNVEVKHENNEEENSVEHIYYEEVNEDIGQDVEFEQEIHYQEIPTKSEIECSSYALSYDAKPTAESEPTEEDDYFWPEQKPAEQPVKVAPKKSAKEREKEPVVCQHCGGIFKRKSLHNHIQIVHFKLKRFTCDKCGYRSYLIREMRYHMMVHSREKHCQCKECGKMFSTPITLSSHKFKVHRQHQERQFMCSSCGKAFKRKCDLNDHIKFKHMDNKKFVCNYEGCGKDFQNRSSFKDHLARHSGVQNLPCDECGKFFFTDHQLKSHKAGHIKSHQCDICDKSFANKRLLLLHHAIHEGKRQFACQYCSNRYYRKPHLVRHITSAHMNIKIKCEIESCSSQFARKATYKNHILSHHKDLGEEKVAELFQKIRELKIEINPSHFTVGY